MNLLILTQAVDKKNPILGFFHRWIEEFSKNCEHVIVICLESGEFGLPANVRVLSLGKETGCSRLKYLWRFYKYIRQERQNYDVVFVHMNQEYVLLGWKFWRLWGKKIWLWRNHAYGNFWTRLAVRLSDRVFCTSPQSFTAQFKKTELMPVGIDTDFFCPDLAVTKKPHSVLFLGRISPVKRALEFVEWFTGLSNDFTATIAGVVMTKDREYERVLKLKIKKLRIENRIKFFGVLSQQEARTLYCSHELYVNLTPAGSMDKTILEAAACQTRVKVENSHLKHLELLGGEDLRRYVVENHSLKKLVKRLCCIVA